MINLGENIRKWMLYRGIGFNQMLTRANGAFSESSLANWLNGHSKPTSKKLELIARVLEIEPEDLYRSPYAPEADIPGKKKMLPILGYTFCGAPAETWSEHTTQYYDAGDTRGFINPFVLIAKGRSMFPFIYEKDKLICSMIENIKKIKPKTLVVVAYKSIPDTAEANAKFIIPKKDYCTLYSVNANYEPFDVPYSNIERIYEVVKIERDPKMR